MLDCSLPATVWRIVIVSSLPLLLSLVQHVVACRTDKAQVQRNHCQPPLENGATVSLVELYGPAYEQLQGIFGLRMRIVTMQLGDERIELTGYLTSGGRPIPQDAKSNDL